MSSSGPLEAFAKAKDLSFRASGSLPKRGNLLNHDGKVEGVVEGKLPGGIDGSLAYFTYTFTTTDSDGNSETHTRRFTVVVTKVPQSIGFMPSLGFAGPSSDMSGVGGSLTEVVQVDLGDDSRLKSSRCYRYKGASETWTRRLLSPGLVDWLARSEDDFGFELADGVLTTSRSEYLGGDAALATLCEEAAHLTAAIAAECDESSNTGTAAATAAKESAADPRMEAALAATAVSPPESIGAAEAAFREHVEGSPRTWWRAFRNAVLIALVINIPAAAVPILMVAYGAWAPLAAIEVGLVGILGFFIFRKDVHDSGKKYAAEAFWRGYAKARGMRLEEPLHFAATHADAKLDWKPDRVLAGPLPGGGEGSFCVIGDGSKRADRVAVVAGPAGPVAEAGLEAEPQGLTAKDLDTFLEQLSGEVRSASPGRAALPGASARR